MTRKVVSLALVLMIGLGSSVTAGSRTRGEERRLEIYRFSANIPLSDDAAVRQRLDAGMYLGDYRVDAYVVVLRLEPGERFVSARIRVRDGFLFRQKRRGSGWTAGRILGTIGYQIALTEVPTPLHSGLSVLGRFMAPPEPQPGVPTLKLQRKLLLRARSVDHGQGYMTTFMPLAANSLTRIELTAIVTERLERRGKMSKKKSWARPVLVPGPDGPGISRDELLRVLASHDPGSRPAAFVDE